MYYTDEPDEVGFDELDVKRIDPIGTIADPTTLMRPLDLLGRVMEGK